MIKRIMGLDPGINETALVVIVEGNIIAEVLKPTVAVGENKYIHEMLIYVLSSVKEFIQKYKPDEVHIEKMFISTGHARSASLVVLQQEISLLCKQHNIPILEVANSTVKKHIANNSRAEKEDIADIINTKFNTSFDNYNITDAIAIALTDPAPKPPKPKSKLCKEEKHNECNGKFVNRKGKNKKCSCECHKKKVKNVKKVL